MRVFHLYLRLAFLCFWLRQPLFHCEAIYFLGEVKVIYYCWIHLLLTLMQKVRHMTPVSGKPRGPHVKIRTLHKKHQLPLMQNLKSVCNMPIYSSTHALQVEIQNFGKNVEPIIEFRYQVVTCMKKDLDWLLNLHILDLLLILTFNLLCRCNKNTKVYNKLAIRIYIFELNCSYHLSEFLCNPMHHFPVSITSVIFTQS